MAPLLHSKSCLKKLGRPKAGKLQVLAKKDSQDGLDNDEADLLLRGHYRTENIVKFMFSLTGSYTIKGLLTFFFISSIFSVSLCFPESKDSK